jgi:hypothetical protein
MRYIDINAVLSRIPLKIINRLAKKDLMLVSSNDQTKQAIITHGKQSWTAVRSILDEASYGKCWYTESINPGCLNDVDHFRPKGKVENDDEPNYWYWFLAFDPHNYRLSCQYSNRCNTNPTTGLIGGKGDKFPLLNVESRASNKAGIAAERPMLLDPCNESDCDLIVFQADGRPAVSPVHKNDVDINKRVEMSNLILNLDFPTFNQGREALYNSVKNLVDLGETSGAGTPTRIFVTGELKNLMDAKSPYSKAAECYVRCFRDRAWVEQLLFS